MPPKEDGTKMPIDKWTRWQSERPSGDQMRRWYDPPAGHEGRTGLGFVCGAVSRNLELFEFDDRATYAAFKATAEAVGLGELVARIEAGYLEDTPGTGVHWFYRCDQIEGNKTLAARPTTPEEMTKPTDKVRTLIQTRGEGGYAVVAPSNGNVHPSHLPYRLVQGGPASIAAITPDERTELWRLARSFDRMPRRTVTAPPAPSGEWTTRPGDAFAAATTWGQILGPHGWEEVFTAGDETYWRRPGKDRGWSATTNYKGSDLLYVFTSSTAFEPERGYGKFGAYALLEHDGDFGQAAKALVERGHGTRAPAPTHVDPETGRVVEDPHLTDLGNAGRLVARHGPDIRWWSTSKRWLVWTGRLWDQGGETEVQERAKETALSIYDESVAATSGERAEALRRWAKTSESARAISSMITLARSDKALTVDADKLDGDPWLFNVQNGTIELTTGTFREHRREDLITKASPVAYDAAAECPRWLSYLDRIFAGDAELIGFVQRAAGYSLTGTTGERVMFILFGSGHNGKTVFIEVMTHIFGEYATVSPVETLIAKKAGGIPNDVARLKSARFVSASETEQGDKLAEAFIKKITGGDKVSARFLNAEWFDFTPQLKLFLATNHRPQISGTDPAIWDRIRLIPFEVQIPEAERDKGLKDWLTGHEAAGILNWALEGCRRWRAEGLAAPEKIRRATASYRVEEDVLGIFVEDCCVVQPLVWCSHKDLFAAFKKWVEDHGEEKMGSKTFSQQMSERPGIRKARTDVARGYSGIRLLGQGADQEDGLP